MKFFILHFPFFILIYKVRILIFSFLLLLSFQNSFFCFNQRLLLLIVFRIHHLKIFSLKFFNFRLLSFIFFSSFFLGFLSFSLFFREFLLYFFDWTVFFLNLLILNLSTDSHISDNSSYWNLPDTSALTRIVVIMSLVIRVIVFFIESWLCLLLTWRLRWWTLISLLILLTHLY